MDIRFEDIKECKLARLEYPSDVMKWLMTVGGMNNYYTYDITDLRLPYKPYRFPLWDNKTYATVVGECVHSVVHVSCARYSAVSCLEMIDGQTYVSSDDKLEYNFLISGNTLAVMQIYYNEGKSSKSTTGLLELSDALLTANRAYTKYLQEQVKEEI